MTAVSNNHLDMIVNKVLKVVGHILVLDNVSGYIMSAYCCISPIAVLFGHCPIKKVLK